MSARLLSLGLLFLALSISGCCWCPGWHRRCCYQEAPPVAPANNSQGR
jgi:hypothetical protein